MALHRDIHWIGRQWAVTGHGMQLIDQKLKGFFDIEVSRLWEDALIESMRTREWLHVADFDKGLEVARKRFPEPPGAVTPAPGAPAPVVPTASPAMAAPSKVTRTPRAEVAAAAAPPLRNLDPVMSPPVAPIAVPVPEVQPDPAPVPSKFQMRFFGYAKFVRPWRVRSRK